MQHFGHCLFLLFLAVPGIEYRGNRESIIIWVKRFKQSFANYGMAMDLYNGGDGFYQSDARPLFSLLNTVSS
jgi:hypothetical protein